MKDLVGQKFGRLTVISFNGRKNGRYLWNCKCECGNDCVVEGHRLKTEGTRSCGCLRKETNTKHGDYKSRLYKIYTSMKYRCSCPTDSGYKNYGGRGIKVCDEWLQDFHNFKEWALNNGYDENAPRGQCTIDRIDVNGNYEPSNCRWITNFEQQSNKRNNTHIEYQGEIYTKKELARKFNINYATFLYRLNYYGWSVEEAVKPARKYKVNKKLK